MRLVLQLYLLSKMSTGHIGSYLENYLESISNLPADLRRNFALMRELDSRCQELIQSIEKQQKTHFTALRTALRNGSKKPSEDVVAQIRKDFSVATGLADEKVALAIQAYNMVDKQIRKLDTDLRRFEIEMGDKTENKVNNRAQKRAAAPAEKGRSVKQKQEEVIPNAIGSDLPIDPNEPTYCYCQRVSFGHMIACDNSECPLEWFHFGCVGLTSKPKGKWLCPTCRKGRKN